MANYIVEHHLWQRQPLWEFIAGYWLAREFGPPPPFADSQGFLDAEINQGRWLVECPQKCGGAITVTSQAPYFLCPYCGSDENLGKWYNVRFPSDKVAIERELLRRPAKDNHHATTRNWRSGETVAALRAENQKRGLD